MKRESNRDRPPPLRIHKPAIATAQQNPRQPLIIHAISPEVIQTDPRNFMSLVQRLTGQAMLSPVIPTKKARLGLGLGLGIASDQQQQQQQQQENDNNMNCDTHNDTSQPLTPNAYNLVSQHQRSMMQLGLGFPQTLNSQQPQQQQQEEKLGLGLGLQQHLSATFQKPDHQQQQQQSSIAASTSFEFNIQENNQATAQTVANYNDQASMAAALLSPSNFILSPQCLPSPSKFFHDWQFLLSPAAASAMAAAAAKSPKVTISGNNNTETSGNHHHHFPPLSPLSFPSPGPLTKALNIDFPPLSPMAGLWNLDSQQKSPKGFSADTSSCIPASGYGYGYGLPPRHPG